MAHVKLASLDSIYKELDHGAVAWFTLVHLVEPPDAMGACSTLAGREPRDT